MTYEEYVRGVRGSVRGTRNTSDVFGKASVEYFGYIFSIDGISASQRRIESMQKARDTTYTQEKPLGYVSICIPFHTRIHSSEQPVQSSAVQGCETAVG